MLSVSNLSCTLRNKIILRDIDLKVDHGQIVGLLGPSGSGKTTLLKHIVGTLPSNGKITMDGKHVPFRGMYSNVGYMLQSDALYEDLSCLDNIVFFAKAMGMKDAIGAANEALELCELTKAKKTPVKEMSGGMKRRLSLGIALVNNPSFLILDEPTVGIDPVLREKFWEFFHKIKKERGVSMIVTTHVMSDAEECDHLYIISNGTIAFSGEVGELKKIAGTDNMDRAYTTITKRLNNASEDSGQPSGAAGGRP